MSYTRMGFKQVIFFCLLATALADLPYIGFSLPPLDGRIVGGNDAMKGEFPHQVSLQWGYISTQHFCGGSIVNNQWVVTAAHCVRAIPGNSGRFLVIAGKHYIKNKEDTEQTIKVAKSWVHEKYGGGVGPYDIALLKLAEPLSLNKNVGAIRLPTPNSEPTGTVILSGWGSTVSSGSSSGMPNALQTVKLPIVDRVTCKKAVEDLTGSTAPLHSTNICTGPLTGGVSACSGDSGGPLINRSNKESEELVGIVSWGIIPCGTRGAPSVYTKVSDFHDWITKIMNAN